MFTVIDILGYEHPFSTEDEVITFAKSQVKFSTKNESKLKNRVSSMKEGELFYIDYFGTSLGFKREK